MILSILILSQIVLSTICVTINLSDQCACSKYSKEMCDLYSYCSWNNDSCGDIICQNKSKNMCSALNTDFKCEFDTTQNICKDKKYTCNDLGKGYCPYSKVFGMNCLWTINNKCEDFNCSLARNCPIDSCAFSNNKCSNPTTKIDCSQLSTSQCNYTQDGYGHICFLNKYNECKSYEYPIECSEWNDQNLLNCLFVGCLIEGQQCRDPKCSDYYRESDCNYIYEDDTNSVTVCKWSGYQCVEATATDISNFSKYDCVQNSDLTYEWDNNKCQKCVASNNDQNSESTTNNSGTSSSGSSSNDTTLNSNGSTSNSSGIASSSGGSTSNNGGSTSNSSGSTTSSSGSTTSSSGSTSNDQTTSSSNGSTQTSSSSGSTSSNSGTTQNANGGSSSTQTNNQTNQNTQTNNTSNQSNSTNSNGQYNTTTQNNENSNNQDDESQTNQQNSDNKNQTIVFTNQTNSEIYNSTQINNQFGLNNSTNSTNSSSNSNSTSSSSNSTNTTDTQLLNNITQQLNVKLDVAEAMEISVKLIGYIIVLPIFLIQI